MLIGFLERPSTRHLWGSSTSTKVSTRWRHSELGGEGWAAVRREHSSFRPGTPTRSLRKTTSAVRMLRGGKHARSILPRGNWNLHARVRGKFGLDEKRAWARTSISSGQSFTDAPI